MGSCFTQEHELRLALTAARARGAAPFELVRVASAHLQRWGLDGSTYNAHLHVLDFISRGRKEPWPMSSPFLVRVGARFFNLAHLVEAHFLPSRTITAEEAAEDSDFEAGTVFDASLTLDFAVPDVRGDQHGDGTGDWRTSLHLVRLRGEQAEALHAWLEQHASDAAAFHQMLRDLERPEVVRHDRRAMATQPAPPRHLCTICHTNEVNAEDGEDTCADCLARQ